MTVPAPWMEDHLHRLGVPAWAVALYLAIPCTTTLALAMARRTR